MLRLYMHADPATLPLKRLHLLLHLNPILGAVLIVILLAPRLLLFFPDRFIPSDRSRLVRLKRGFKSLLVLIVNFFIAAVVLNDIAKVILFELLWVKVAPVPISLSEIIFGDQP